MSGLINHLLEEYYAGREPRAKFIEPTYEVPTPDLKKPTNTSIKGADEAPAAFKVMSNDDLKALLGQAIEDKPRHTCKENCYHWVYDINSAQYVNSLTGETREAPEF